MVSVAHTVLPETRAEAIEGGSTRYFTGQACKRGHKAERFTINGACVECVYEGRRKILEQRERVANGG